MQLKLVLVACVAVAAAAGAAPPVPLEKASMSVSGGKCIAGGSAASGTFADTMSTLGWGVLRVSTSAKATPAEQAFAAGCVEAKLTARDTYFYWLNYMKEEYGAEVPPPKVVAFMEHQQAWLRAQIADSANAKDGYWQAMALVLAQWDGFAQGIQQFATAEQLKILTKSSLYLLCSVGDLETINGLVHNMDTPIERVPLPLPGLATEDMLPCSSLISLQTGADGSVTDIFASQATWRSYYAMLRIYKVYAFDYYPQKVLTIASSPGLLHSKDDFLSSPTLYVAETTNMVSNRSMVAWNRKHSNATATSWQRSMVATGWASSGKQWVELFAKENNGCYNNQWMVLDATKVEVGKPLQKQDVLWIAEQVPGLVATLDVTGVLHSKGFWPSYNIAYIPEIYAWSGYPSNRSSAGGFDGAPRARIFARDAPKVKSWAAFKKLIRYNDFEADPVCAPPKRAGDHHGVRRGSCAIAARGDLPLGKGSAFGGIDAKVLKVSSMHAVLPPSGKPPLVEAQSGPSHDQQKPFRWAQFPNVSHAGLPDVFDFDWMTIS